MIDWYTNLLNSHSTLYYICCGCIKLIYTEFVSTSLDCCLSYLWYLIGALSKGLYYRPSSHLGIMRYSDADSAGDHCITGCCTFIIGNMVTWRLKNKILLLDSVLKLSIKSWLIHIVNWCELNLFFLKIGVIYNKPTVMYCNNQAIMYIVNNPFFRKQTKHI